MALLYDSNLQDLFIEVATTGIMIDAGRALYYYDTFFFLEVTTSRAAKGFLPPLVPIRSFSRHTAYPILFSRSFSGHYYWSETARTSSCIIM
jgi:hypothetical protein